LPKLKRTKKAGWVKIYDWVAGPQDLCVCVSCQTARP